MSKLTISDIEKFSVERKIISYMTTKSWQNYTSCILYV